MVEFWVWMALMGRQSRAADWEGGEKRRQAQLLTTQLLKERIDVSLTSHLGFLFLTYGREREVRRGRRVR